MKILSIACAATCTLALATAAATPAYAQTSTPGAAPPPRTGPKVAPPPRVREIDKHATRPLPPGGAPTRPDPKPVDDFAGKPGGQKPVAWEQTCNDSVHCEFLRSLCTAKGGGMSTNPDGSETCTVHEKGPVVSGAYSGPVRPPKPPRPGIGTFTGIPTGPQPYVVKWTCSGEKSCAYLEYGCSMVGGGMSTNPDGTKTCTVES